MFTYPPEIGPHRYRFADVMLAAHGPAKAAGLLRRFATGDVAHDAFLPAFNDSLLASADRFDAMAAMIVE